MAVHFVDFTMKHIGLPPVSRKEYLTNENACLLVTAELPLSVYPCEIDKILWVCVQVKGMKLVEYDRVCGLI